MITDQGLLINYYLSIIIHAEVSAIAARNNTLAVVNNMLVAVNSKIFIVNNTIVGTSATAIILSPRDEVPATLG